MAASERASAMMLTPRVAWVHQIHAAGGASGSTTMVMVLGELCFLCVFYSTIVGRRKWREPYF